MTALLEDRVCAYIADHPGVTVAEIQRAVPCLSTTLAEILANPLFVQRDGCYRIAGTRGTRGNRRRLGETRDPTGGARVSPNGQLTLAGPEFWRGEAA